ncbi:uncharacterized protein LOC124418763 [Lucilia cuprina]|uniref:uncharacterized protein LOC124418763 n=1 Tax=Lucilia cuprina TaxID=7375 RepID=UPI001F059412|nr:uncharacterized protein LOC124418763 [Lucilia cuprina]
MVLIKIHIRRRSEVTVYVDSQAALKALKCHVVHSRLVSSCRDAIRELTGMFKIKLCWVPGRCNIQCNEIADELARQGSDLDNNSGNLLSATTIVSKALWPRLNAKASRTLLGLDRRSIRIIVGEKTGHCAIGAFLGNWVFNTQEFCRLCEDEEELETVDHILCDCPGAQSLRRKWLGKTFHDDLVDVARCSLDHILDFVRGVDWLLRRQTS